MPYKPLTNQSTVYHDEKYQRLQELEKKIMQGNILIPPCDIGTELFIVYRYGHGKRNAGTKKHHYKIRATRLETWNYYDVCKQFGSIYFLDKATAEKRKQELNEQEDTLGNWLWQ